MSIAGASDVVFGPFRLSVRDRMLSNSEQRVALPSRAFDVLLSLIESRAIVVPKDELMRRVWGDVVVEENNLHVQIAAVRRALGPEKRRILTVPGRGYRFVGDVQLTAGDGRNARPSVARRTNLPAEMTPMIGRDDELAAVCALLERSRLITVCGPVGVGKSRLALAAARSLSDGAPNECWLLEVGQTGGPCQAPRSLADALKVNGRQDSLEGVAEALRARTALLVLDGCESAVEPAAALARQLLLRCPQIRILATGQMPLGLEAEHVLRLGPFDLPRDDPGVTAEQALRFPAVRLFAERAGACDSRFAIADEVAPSVVEICRCLDGLPLAIELAAARAPFIGLARLRALVADRPTLLADDRRDRPRRHRALGDAVGWSCRLLGDLERRVLRRLGVFAGGFTLEAAQAVAGSEGIAPLEVARVVGDLAQRSLVMTEFDPIRPRHHLLQVVRDFVRHDQGFAEEAFGLARRHAEYYLALAESPLEAKALSNPDGRGGDLAPEIDNLRAALEWSSSARGDARLGARLSEALGRHWWRRDVGPESAAGLSARRLTPLSRRPGGADMSPRVRAPAPETFEVPH